MILVEIVIDRRMFNADQAENRSFQLVFTGFCPESDRAAQKNRGAAQKIRGAARRFFPPVVLNR